MLGSQIIDYAGSIAGYEVGLQEIERFGYANFPSAVATGDSWNQHDGCEIVFLLQGEACWEIDGKLLLPLTGGNCAVFPADRKHRIANGIYPPCNCFWIVLNKAATMDPARPTLMGAKSLSSFERALGHYSLTQKISGVCLGSIGETLRLMKDKRLYSGASLLVSELRAHLHLIMVETWKAHAQKQRNPADTTLVSNVLSRLHEADDELPTVSHLARELNCSRGHLHKSFTREIGMPPSDYAQRLRIKRACSRLVMREQSITNIALDSGFGSSQHFAKVFRKYIGLTPSEYRLQLREKALRQ